MPQPSAVPEVPVEIRASDTACEGCFLNGGPIESLASCALFASVTEGMSDVRIAIARSVLSHGGGGNLPEKT